MDRQVTARLPDSMIAALDEAARQRRLSREAIIHMALEHFLEDCDDLSVATKRLQDPSD